MTTLTLLRPLAPAVERESLTRIRATLRLVETQAREGIVRWVEDDGTAYTGTLWRGVRDAQGNVTGGSDPRDHLVLVTTRGAHAPGEVLVPFNHLIDLAEVGQCQSVTKTLSR
jgi:hypothetical protein